MINISLVETITLCKYKNEFYLKFSFKNEVVKLNSSSNFSCATPGWGFVYPATTTSVTLIKIHASNNISIFFNFFIIIYINDWKLHK